MSMTDLPWKSLREKVVPAASWKRKSGAGSPPSKPEPLYSSQSMMTPGPLIKSGSASSPVGLIAVGFVAVGLIAVRFIIVGVAVGVVVGWVTLQQTVVVSPTIRIAASAITTNTFNILTIKNLFCNYTPKGSS